jgi:hypothetical protein
MPEIACLYLDDSGTRNPDRKADGTVDRDWFALGGIIINEEDVPTAEKAHEEFCTRWGIKYPLRSFDIRQKSKSFSWLRTLSPANYLAFMQDLSGVLVALPVIGHGCVIDRPGYNARYREQYGRQTWMLCKTAFSVVCERSAKHASERGRRLRVYPEAGDKTADDHVRSYYKDMRSVGMPFADASSAKYGPLSAAELKETLYDLKFKNKNSRLAQLADLYLYPIARGRYEDKYLPYALLRQNKKLMDDLLDADRLPHLGIKYSFELIDAALETQKPEQAPVDAQPPQG